MIIIKKSDLDQHRKSWEEIAKKNGWHSDPFYIVVWVNKIGRICDSVSFRDMTEDVFLEKETDYTIEKGDYIIE